MRELERQLQMVVEDNNRRNDELLSDLDGRDQASKNLQTELKQLGKEKQDL